jgi:hypothetical protein
VTREGEIVWQFVNPVRGGEQNGKIPIICWAQRVDPDHFDSDFLSGPVATRAPARPAARASPGPA